jgi:hypothetical protein
MRTSHRGGGGKILYMYIYVCGKGMGGKESGVPIVNQK